MQSKTFQEVISASNALIDAFEKVEKRPWGAEGASLELMKQVGELSKMILSAEGYYMAGRDTVEEFNATKSKIADELSDIFLMLVRIARHYDINLEEAHFTAMEEAAAHPLMKIQKQE
ncbi:MAG: hypothetical protein ACOYT9_03445 [Patescibacteria group bacterium]